MAGGQRHLAAVAGVLAPSRRVRCTGGCRHGCVLRRRRAVPVPGRTPGRPHRSPARLAHGPPVLRRGQRCLPASGQPGGGCGPSCPAGSGSGSGRGGVTGHGVRRGIARATGPGLRVHLRRTTGRDRHRTVGGEPVWCRGHGDHLRCRRRRVIGCLPAGTGGIRVRRPAGLGRRPGSQPPGPRGLPSLNRALLGSLVAAAAIGLTFGVYESCWTLLLDARGAKDWQIG